MFSLGNIVHVRTASKKCLLQIVFGLKTLLAQFLAWVFVIGCTRVNNITKDSLAMNADYSPMS